VSIARMRMGLTRLDGSLSHNQRSRAMIGQERPARPDSKSAFLVTLNRHVVDRVAATRGRGERRATARLARG
jgi:hypothetical protein